MRHKTTKCVDPKGETVRTALFTWAPVVFLLWMLGAGEAAQSDDRPISALSTASAAQRARSVSASPTPNCPPPDGKLKLVVALFRHGVRAPLVEFAGKAHEHSKEEWPNLPEWGADNWGDLTRHGFQAVEVLGAYYGRYYSKVWGNSFKAYLWADVDERTRATACALAEGMRGSGVDVKVESLCPQKLNPCPEKLDPFPQLVDPLFHPFKAICGTPDPNQIRRIVGYINNNWQGWIKRSFLSEFRDLYAVLACNDKECKQPLWQVIDRAAPSPLESPRPSSPIKWAGQFPTTPTPIPTDGQFPYANSATEAFLLEYANGMDPNKVGWGNVINEKTGSTYKLRKLLQLHEFYFTQTAREQYLAGIQGANLVREILDQLNRKAGRPVLGKCPRANAESQFVGLIGHDTNLANLNKLLHVDWSYDNNQLPPDIRGLPPNDALPAGALVFELREGSPDYKIRIQYVTQSLNQMREAPKPGDPYRVQTTCGGKNRKDVPPCEMTRQAFNDLIKKAINKYSEFLSGCQDDRQVCAQAPAQMP
jgi:4-phytase / acid phosphatase